MKEWKLVIFLCCHLILPKSWAAPTAELQSAQVLQNAGLRTYQTDNKWYINLPPFIYDLCALYYMVPDCLSEMFGEEIEDFDDFDVSSMLDEICPI